MSSTLGEFLQAYLKYADKEFWNMKHFKNNTVLVSLLF